jgi:8-oxo-dGTP pyrophosphatase MutT (NUDIX family)
LNLSPEQISRLLEKALPDPNASPFPEYSFPPEWPKSDQRPAAVLIPMLKLEDGWHILFTRRTPHLAEHSGQVAFPGGRADPHDQGPEQTAMREAWEEIGLEPQDVRILGRLMDFVTITNYRVTPVVGQIPWPYPLKLATEEVSRVFTIPLDWLADPENVEEQQRILPDPFPPASVFYFRPYDGEVLWGASARFTLTLVNILSRNGTVPSIRFTAS